MERGLEGRRGGGVGGGAGRGSKPRLNGSFAKLGYLYGSPHNEDYNILGKLPHVFDALGQLTKPQALRLYDPNTVAHRWRCEQTTCCRRAKSCYSSLTSECLLESLLQQTSPVSMGDHIAII